MGAVRMVEMEKKNLFFDHIASTMLKVIKIEYIGNFVFDCILGTLLKIIEENFSRILKWGSYFGNLSKGKII